MSEVIVKHFGNAGHLCVGSQCRFHLCTLVGKYLVSTVGQYFPDSTVREIYAKNRNVTLSGMGDAREYDYMRKIGYEEIGCGRLFETMVFEAGKLCDSPECMCGLPAIGGSEIDFEPYNTAGEANKGHAEMVEKWRQRQSGAADVLVDARAGYEAGETPSE